VADGTTTEPSAAVASAALDATARRQRWKVLAFVGATILLAGAATAIVVRISRDLPIIPHDYLGLIFFSVFLVAGEITRLKWLKLHDGGEITPSWAFAFSILLLPAPVMALVAMGVACIVGDLWHRKSLDRVAFNVGQTVLSLGTAAIVMCGLHVDDIIGRRQPLTFLWAVGLVIAAFSMFTVNGLMTCTVLALHEGTKVRTMLRRGMFLNLVTDGALVSLAPVFVVVSQRSILLLPLAVVVAGLVHYNTRAALASEHEANHDVLTELPNRRAFLARLDSELRDRQARRRCALLLIDLDGFKEINDRLGHQAGDAVLREIGTRLRASQQPGLIAARLGGDEFAVLVTQVDTVERLAAWADALREDLARPCVTTGLPLSLTSSVGLALWPDHGADPTELFQAADLAMYSAKKTGNAAKLYRSELSSSTGRIELLADLEAGIARGELEMWYQPQVDVRTGDVVAMEALVRWRHPRFGLVMPGDFMPTAEHTDLMVPITAAVIDMSVRDAVRWRTIFPTVRVAVNASARNLHDLGFPKMVGACLKAHQAPPALLEIEITENTVIRQPERTRVVLESLGELGVRSSIDDFGTGYSSLAHLRSLPVQAIKIDRSFVTDIANDTDDQVIVRSIIELAHNLGLETVAEGVETSEATRMLYEFGADHMQGYLVARPMPFDDALQWLVRAHQVNARPFLPTSAVLDLRPSPLELS
jgi:diguanylate cyclase